MFEQSPSDPALTESAPSRLLTSGFKFEGTTLQHIRRLALTIILVLFNAPAFAYIDPNAGGYLFQLLAPLIAIVMSGWIFFSNEVKAIWRSFRRIFLRKMDKE